MGYPISLSLFLLMCFFGDLKGVTAHKVGDKQTLHGLGLRAEVEAFASRVMVSHD